MKKHKVLCYVMLGLTIAVNLFIIINGFIDGAESSKTSGAISQVIEDGINTLSPGTITEVNRAQFKFLTRKIVGHFLLNGLSGILTTFTYYLFLKTTKLKNIFFAIVFSLVTGFVVGLTSELAQLTAKDRVFSMTDVGIDFAGFTIGLIVTIIIVLISWLIASDLNQKKQVE